MAIKATFDIDKIFEELKQTKLPFLQQAVQEALRLSLLDTQTEAKMVDTYKDQTNNLRSSIGYVIYIDGEKVAENFEAAGVGTNGDGGSGTSRGREFADQMALQFPTGIVGVLVAGMEYAIYVEAKGYDVITGSSQHLVGRFENNLKIALEAARELQQ